MIKRMGMRSLEQENGCRDYAASLTKALDERLAKEAAGPVPETPEK